MTEHIQTIVRTAAIKNSKDDVFWDGYQKEVSVKKQVVIKPAYADRMEAVTVLTTDVQGPVSRRLRLLEYNGPENVSQNVKRQKPTYRPMKAVMRSRKKATANVWRESDSKGPHTCSSCTSCTW